MHEPPSVELLLSKALEIAVPEERAAFLDRACAGDPILRRELGSLVDAHFAADRFLDPGTRAHEEKPGDRIGRYRLIEAIGEGGFGRVWMAEQQEPVKRVVALKIVKAGMDTREVLARFEAERQSLAMMDHPNIAKVFDGGATASGRPYFVMELVRGVPVTDYCNAAKLTASERAALMEEICRAVHHAHRKGIIHRDLKPSNLLVALEEGKAVPKVIDFGIAKAIHDTPGSGPALTSIGRMIGTPQYMSPEQADPGFADIDTRSDIYALGVVLYELLTGGTPLDAGQLRSAGVAEMRRRIREEVLPKPGTWSGDPSKSTVTSGLNRDLEWIVMKALEKERDRRYDSAAAFAADLGRYLAGEAIEARPPSRIYRLRKAVHRNRLSIAAASAVLAAILAGAAASIGQAARADKERAAAVEAMRRADAESLRFRAQLREAARSDRLAAVGMLGSGRVRDAFAHLARACDYDPDCPLAAETAILQLNTLNLAREIRVLQGEGEFPLEPLNRNGLMQRLDAGGWDAPRDAAFSPDGRHVLSFRWGRPQAIGSLWDAGTGRLVESIPLSTPDDAANPWFAELATRAGTFRFNGPWEESADRSFPVPSPDGTRRLAREGDAILIRDQRSTEPGTLLPDLAAETHTARFSSDGLWIATGGEDGTLGLRDGLSGEVVSLGLGHAGAVTQARFSDDGARLATSSEDTTIRLWETADRRLRDQLGGIGSGRLESVEFTPGGRSLLGSDFSGGWWIWDLPGGEAPRRLAVPEDGAPVAINAGATLAVLQKDDGRTVLADLAGHGTIATLGGRSEQITGAVFSGDDRCLATHGKDGVVRFWETRDGRLMAATRGDFATAGMLMFAPDGKQLFLSPEQGAASIIDVRSGTTRFTLDPGAGTSITAACFHPGGKLLATGSNDAVARIWDTATGRQVAALGEHPQTVKSVDFSPDGSLLATACWRERLVQVWDTTSWHRVSRLQKAPFELMEEARFSPDSRLLATGSDRADALNLWHARSGQLLASLDREGADLRSFDFSPDGRWIATASSSGGPMLWEIPGIGSPLPPWFADFLRLLVQRRIDSDGRPRNLAPAETELLRQKVAAGASGEGRCAEIARWFLLPAADRPIRPGESLTRRELAGRLVTADPGPDRILRALRFDPSDLPAHLALSRLETDRLRSDFLARWTMERLPDPMPDELRLKIRSLREAPGENTPSSR